LKKEISKTLCVKNIVVWAVIGCCGILALGNFIKLFFDDLSKGKEIFLPGVLALAVVTLALLFFSATRILKYLRIFRVST
jgi:hypothetical protein